MSTRVLAEGTQYLFVKGAPEIVLAKCDLDDKEKQKAQEELADFQRKAMRTLAFAYQKAEDGKMTLQAIVAITDPLRKEVPAAV